MLVVGSVLVIGILIVLLFMV